VPAETTGTAAAAVQGGAAPAAPAPRRLGLALAVIAAVTLTHHSGRTEGVNGKTKMLKRQMFGRVGFELLRHRILLG
jgi:hypothetical protein